MDARNHPRSTKRCGTCIDRKIRCDRGLPVCSNCFRSKRICQGYSLRLSWPRDGDPKRTMVGPSPPRGSQVSTNHLHLIRASCLDLGIYYYFRAHRQLTKPLIPTFLAWAPSKLTTREAQLIHYFDSALSFGITTFNERPLGGLLLCLARSNNCAASVAVQRALLAVSCLFQVGPGLQAEQLKLSAIYALRASAETGVSADNAPQHVAAGMLLCLFEIHCHSESSSQWFRYISGVKDVLSCVSVDALDQDPSLSALLDWVYYHEVLTGFSFLHWRPRSSLLSRSSWPFSSPGDPDPDSSRSKQWQSDQRLRPCTSVEQRNNSIRLLAMVCASVLPSSDPRSLTENYQSHLQELQRAIEHIEASDTSEVSSDNLNAGPGTNTRATIMGRLYRLAALIYLIRASGSHATQRQKFQAYVEQGLGILRGVWHCERPFPVLIIGFEADRDEDRIMVLSMTCKTEDRPPARRMNCMEALLHAMWNQKDLQGEGEEEMDYMEVLTTIVSLHGAIPPFV